MPIGEQKSEARTEFHLRRACSRRLPQGTIHREDGKKADHVHVLYLDCSDYRCLAQFDQARRKESQILLNPLPGLG